MMEFVATAFVTFFVVIDPVGNAPIFLGLTANESREHRRRIAVKAVLISAVTLVVFALVGEIFLRLLGITLPAVRIAGGALLFLLSVDMVFARQSGIRTMTDTEAHEAEDRGDLAVFPLAVPLIAGPGAITSIILLMGQAGGDPLLQGLVVLIMLGVLALCLLSLLFASVLMAAMGVTGVNVVGRVLGIVLAALAVQYVLDGFSGVSALGNPA